MDETRKAREIRTATYRILAVEAEDMAVKQTTPQLREAYLTLAIGWHNLARETSKPL